jgi:hemoglobin
MAANFVAQAGGAERLREILVDFYDRVFADVMIGYLFKRANKERLVERELELALSAMGEDVAYQGKDLRAAHAPHQIQGGHFERRQQILRETCDEHGLPAAVRDFWLAHNEQLRPLITKMSRSDCE